MRLVQVDETFFLADECLYRELHSDTDHHTQTDKLRDSDLVAKKNQVKK